MIEIFKNLEKYNLWHQKKTVPAGYKRKGYLERLKPYLGNRLVKVIIGQRRVGKSYLLRQIMGQMLEAGVKPKNIFYLNKEFVEFDVIKTHQDLQRLLTYTYNQLKVKGKRYIFLDEVQEISGWERIVNSLSQNFKEEYEVFITGSNSTMLSGELATLLSGRSLSFEVLPFSFLEFIDYLGLECNRKNYLAYLQSGGLPELFHLKEEETKRHYISSLKDTILLKDIVERFQIKDAVLLEHVFSFLVDNVGNLFSVNSIVNYLSSHRQKTNYETISSYVQYLCQCFLVHEADRFDIKGKALLSGSKKYYLNDFSFRNFLSSGFEAGLQRHLENAVYLYYRGKGYKVYVGTLDKGEVDFILEKDNEREYVQVTYALNSPKVTQREFSSLEAIKDNYPKRVISLDDVSFGNKEGIEHVLAWELD